ncbi:MAG: hypothetical protein Q8P93_03540 [bacterium]|nr:hypothetical protein [bacterium]
MLKIVVLFEGLSLEEESVLFEDLPEGWATVRSFDRELPATAGVGLVELYMSLCRPGHLARLVVEDDEFELVVTTADEAGRLICLGYEQMILQTAMEAIHHLFTVEEMV